MALSDQDRRRFEEIAQTLPLNKQGRRLAAKLGKTRPSRAVRRELRKMRRAAG